MRNVSNKSCRENQNTHFVLSNFFFLNRVVYEIMRENLVERDRPQMTIWHMRHCMLDTLGYKYTISGFVTLLDFLLQQTRGRLNATNMYIGPLVFIYVLWTVVLHLHTAKSFGPLTLILLTWRIWWAPNNENRRQMGFNSAFKGLYGILWI